VLRAWFGNDVQKRNETVKASKTDDNGSSSRRRLTTGASFFIIRG